MATPRRLWDACVVLAYLSGDEEVAPDCELIIVNQAEKGVVEIVVSTIAEAEVAYLPGLSPADSEAKIREFFSREYVVIASFDSPIARIARRLIRQYPGLKPEDAVHMATSLQWHIPIIETIDAGLLKLDGKEGNPPIIIRKPFYQGPMDMFPPQNPVI